MAREAIAVCIESFAAHNEGLPTEKPTLETAVLLEQHARNIGFNSKRVYIEDRPMRIRSGIAAG